jgi:hypothetical protein
MSYDALAEREANLRALNEELDTRIQTVATLSSSSSSSSTAFAPSPLSFDLGEGDGDGIEQQQQQLPSFSSSSAAFNNLKQVASPQKDTSPVNAPRTPILSSSSSSSSSALQKSEINRIGGSRIPLRASISIPKMNRKELSSSTTTRDDIINNNSSGYGQSPPAHTSPSSISTNAISSGVSAVKLLMPDPDLPTDVQLKLLRAHLEHAIDEATSAEREATRLKTDLAISRKEVHKLSEEVARSTRALSTTEAAANKARALAASAEGRENDFRVQLQQLQREQSSSAKAKHSSGAHTEPSAVEARLHRANEEIEKLKCQLVNERKEAADLTSSLKRDLEVALERAKKSDRQRGELLAAFRKQLKLVDILRRQRVHMEAARMLGFAEEEFVKLMEQHGNK